MQGHLPKHSPPLPSPLSPRLGQGAMPATSLTRYAMLGHTKLPTSTTPGGGKL